MKKKLFTITIAIIAAIAVIIFAFIVWFGSNERPIPFEGRILRSINSQLSPIVIAPQKVRLKLNATSNYLEIRAYDTSIFNGSDIIADLNYVTINTSILKLINPKKMGFDVHFKDLSTLLNLPKSKDNGLSGSSFGTADVNFNNIFAMADANADLLRNTHLYFDNIEISDSIAFSLDDVHMISEGDGHLILECKAQSEFVEVPIKMDVKLLQNNEVQVVLDKQSFKLKNGDLFGPMKFKNDKLLLDASATLNHNMELVQNSFALTGSVQVMYDGIAYNIDALNARGSANLRQEQIDIKNIEATIDGHKVWGSAQILNTDDIIVHANIAEGEYKKLIRYVPKSLIPEVKKWLDDSIEAGMASVSMAIKYNLKNDKTTYNLQVPFKNVQLRYQKNMPIINNASGIANISQDKVVVDLADGSISGVDIKKGTGLIDLTPDDLYLDLDIYFATEKVNRALDLVGAILDKELPKFGEDADITNHLVVRVPLKKKLKIKDIAFRGKAELIFKNFKQLNSNQLENLRVTLNYNADQLKGEGTVLFAKKIPLTLAYQKKIEDVAEFRLADIDISYQGTAQELRKIYPELPLSIAGKTTLHIKMLSEPGASGTPMKIALQSDLEGIEMDEGKYFLAKRKEQKGKLELVITAPSSQKSGLTHISDIILQMQNTTLNGSATITPQGAVSTLNLKLDRGQAGNIHITDQAGVLSVKSDYFDLSDSNIFDLISGKRGKQGDFEARFSRLRLKNGVELAGLVISNKFCPDCKLDLQSAFAGTEDRTISLVKNDGNLIIKSNDAGSLIRGLNIYKKIEGGKLELKLEGDSVNQSGVLTIHDFIANKNNFFVKLFALPSLTVSPQATRDILEGNGLRFNVFRCPISIQGSTIKFNRCIAKGDAINIKIKGTINLTEGVVDMQGLFIPNNILNAIVKNIPLVGGLLSGKKDEGIIATNFYISGSVQDPHIAINPLSTLTPGFTREIMNLLQ